LLPDALTQTSAANDVSEKTGTPFILPQELCAMEFEWQARFIAMFGGSRASCPHKKIADVVTDHFLIEIKKAKSVKSWGTYTQLEHFVTCFPGRRNILFVFGIASSKFDWKSFIEKIADLHVEVRFEIPPPGFEDHLMLTSKEIADGKKKALADAKTDEIEARQFKVAEGINPMSETFRTLQDLETTLTALHAAKEKLREGYVYEMVVQIENHMDEVLQLWNERKRALVRMEWEDDRLSEFFDEELVFGETCSIPSKELDNHYSEWVKKADRSYNYNIYRQALYRRGVFVKCVEPKVNGKPVRGPDGKRHRTSYLMHVAIKPPPPKTKSHPSEKQNSPDTSEVPDS
jgi:hypothetical protein